MGFSVIPEPAISGFTGPQGPAGTIPSDPTFASSASINDTSGDPTFNLKKNGLTRWKIRSAGTESGSNNGSDLWVEAIADDGTTKINDPLWISRTTGQVAIGIANSSQGGVKLSINGAVGMRDMADPTTTGLGAQLYSKSGKLWVQTSNGVDKFQVVNSVAKAGNNQIDGQYLWLNTAAGTYRALGFRTDGVDRWLFQVDDLAESGSAAGSNFRLSARNDDGSFNKTVIYARRDTGQITFNTTVLHGSANVTSAGAIGIRDQAADPATTTGGAFIYSKGGIAYVKQGDGTVFQLGAGGGGGGAVSSVNGKTGVVTLAASDVNALPTDADGSTTGRVTSAKGFSVNSTDINQNPILTDSPAGQAARLAVMRVNGVDQFSLGSTGSLTLAGGLTAGATSTVPNLRLGSTSTGFAGGSGSIIAMADATTIPNATPTGAVLYVEAGVLKVRQKDGTVVTVANNPTIPVTSVNSKTGAVSLTAADVSAIPTSQKAAASGVASLDSSSNVPVAQLPDLAIPGQFVPNDLGMKAWAFDPGLGYSDVVYPSVNSLRVTAVPVHRTMSVSKIVWHLFGYNNGITAGDACIYDSTGAKLRSTGSLVGAKVPEAHDIGGRTVGINLTSAVTLTPGVYYVAFYVNYTTGNGPGMLVAESASNKIPSFMGLNNVLRYGVIPSTTALPATLNFSAFNVDANTSGPNRFWQGLA